MGFFRVNRSDGIRVTSADPLVTMMPYLFRTRTESIVYYKRTIPIDEIQKYIVEQRRKGARITMFSIIVAAMLQTVYRRPNMNRFIAGCRMYMHKNFEVLYTVKQSLTDDGLESVAKVRLNPEDTIFNVAKAMSEHTHNIKKGELKEDDKLIRFFCHMPRWFIRTFMTLLRFLDFYGWMPQSLIDALPFYSTVFISHLGSLGAEAPFHHLYEFGTNSIFVTIGRTYEVPYKGEDGKIEWRRSIDLAFTVDERICDGFYLISSLKMLEQFMLNPCLLEYPAKDLIDIHYPKTWPEKARQHYHTMGEFGKKIESREDLQ